MNKNHASILTLALGFSFALGCTILASAATADDFRIDNRVYVGDEKKPDSQGTTIFYGGIVYDFLEDPTEIIVFDPKTQRFTLVDVRHKIRTDLAGIDVETFIGRIKQRVATQRDPMTKFAANPQFEEKFNQDIPEVTLQSPVMTYNVRVLTTGPDVSRQYREFSDWYARLNTVLTPGSRLPFARLALNEAIAKHQAVAREVRLTITPQSPAGAKPVTAKSQHDLVLKLEPADITRVAQSRELLRTAKEVAFEEYAKGRKR
jgi:hypothetical protein